MTTRFAGSRALDERRRRRLATESDTEPTPAEAAPRRTRRSTVEAADASSCAPHDAPQNGRVEFPLHKVISENAAKLWLLGLALVTLAAGLVAWEHFARKALESGLPHAALSLDGSARTAGFLGRLQLLLASQFAWLIWWRRSRSRSDFGGSYRIWAWASAVLFMAAATHALEGHRAFASGVQWTLKFDLGRWRDLCWLIPATAVGHALFSSIQRDMRGCRSSRFLIWLCFGCFLGAAVIHMGGTALLPAATGPTVRSGLLLFGTFTLFQSLLLHTRFVLYESSEPPQTPPGRVRQWWSRLGERWQQSREARRERGDAKRRLRAERSAEKRAQAEAKAAAKAEAKKEQRARAAEKAGSKKAVKARERAEDSDKTSPDPSSSQGPRGSSRKPAKPARASKRIADEDELQAADSAENSAPSRKAAAAESTGDTPTRSVADRTRGERDSRPEKSPAPAKSDSRAEPARFDAADDPPSLKGLSKRERRKLRKEWREAQRGG